MSGFSILNVKAITSISGKWSIDENGLIIAAKVRTKGLELIDEDTGEIYCVKVKSGSLSHTAGECGVTQESASDNPDASAGAGSEQITDNNGEVVGESIEVNDDNNNDNDQTGTEEPSDVIPDATTTESSGEAPTEETTEAAEEPVVETTEAPAEVAAE
ncbi:MAG: hypothetical protein HYV13_01475 [Candidatus Doudnabacteria bacterium]|nr:hypothetical protein [Candidatus Doudnabacteria bacterium]